MVAIPSNGTRAGLRRRGRAVPTMRTSGSAVGMWREVETDLSFDPVPRVEARRQQRRVVLPASANLYPRQESSTRGGASTGAGSSDGAASSTGYSSINGQETFSTPETETQGQESSSDAPTPTTSAAQRSTTIAQSTRSQDPTTSQDNNTSATPTSTAGNTSNEGGNTSSNDYNTSSSSSSNNDQTSTGNQYISSTPNGSTSTSSIADNTPTTSSNPPETTSQAPTTSSATPTSTRQQPTTSQEQTTIQQQTTSQAPSSSNTVPQTSRTSSAQGASSSTPAQTTSGGGSISGATSQSRSSSAVSNPSSATSLTEVTQTAVVSGSTITSVGPTPVASTITNTDPNRGSLYLSSSASVYTSEITSNGSVMQITGTTVIVVTATSNSYTAGKKSGPNGGLIGGVVGGVVGGVAALTLLLLLLLLLRRRKSRTGSAWFLCFGKRPMYGDKADLTHGAGNNWPSFDPGQEGAHEMADTNMAHLYTDDDGALPEPEEHISDAGATAATSGVNTRLGSEHPSTYYSTPNYDHLDPPDVREERAQEAAAVASSVGAGTASAGGHSGHLYNSSAGALYHPYSDAETYYNGTNAPTYSPPANQQDLSHDYPPHGANESNSSNNSLQGQPSYPPTFNLDQTGVVRSQSGMSAYRDVLQPSPNWSLPEGSAQHADEHTPLVVSNPSGQA